jgi:drug/metabolite transporter (DMT)-like permease
MSDDTSLTARQIVAANLGFVVMTALWGAFFPAVERLLLRWDLLSVSTGRQIVGAAVLLGTLAMIERRSPLRRRLPWGRVFVLGWIGITLGSLVTTAAVYFSSGIAAAIVSASNPISSTLIAWLLQRVSLGRGLLIGTALSVVGGLVAVIGVTGGTEFHGGELLIVVANVIWTWYSITTQRWLKGCSQLEIAGLTVFTGAIGLLLICGLGWTMGLLRFRLSFDVESVLLLLFAGAMPIALGNFLWLYGVARVGIVVGSMYNNLIPVAAVLTGLTVGLLPSTQQLVGGAIIVAGVLYSQIAALRARRQPKAEG